METETWETVRIKGQVPEPRAGAASTSIGDRMYVFGGEGDEVIFSDLFIYDDIHEEWSQAPAPNLPSARAYACMSSYYPYLFIFGGITVNGYTDEVWCIDIKDFSSSLLSSDNLSGPKPSAFTGCQIEEELGELFLYVYAGETSGETPLDQVFKISIPTLQWTSFGNFIPRSQAATLKVRNHILLVGGEEWGLEANDTVNIMDISTGDKSVLTTLPESIYSAASRYYKTSLYIFGGGDKLGEKFRSSVPVHNFYKLDLNSNCGEYCNWPCSPGTYLASQGVCRFCNEGYFSDGYGLSFCEACPEGTFSRRKGNSSIRQCYPCEEGFYNPTPGSRLCLSCPMSYVCEIGSAYPQPNSKVTNSIISSQPDLFKSGVDKVNSQTQKLQLGFLGIGVLAILVSITFKRKLYHAIAYLDLFDQQHNHEFDVPLIKHKNFYGGFFSMIFYICAVFYLVAAILIYAWDNVEEIKALVPLVTLEREYNDVRFTQIEAYVVITVEFGSYGGTCANQDGSCIASITSVASGFTASRLETSCDLIGQACIVSIVCRDCQFGLGAKVDYLLAEDWSYANYIQTKIESSSSIPNESSSVQLLITPASGKVFRGSVASLMYFELIPSVFTSESDAWDHELSGYHISAPKKTIKGSSSSISEIPGTFGLQLTVIMELSNTGLLTQRRLKQSVLILLSSILGSFFGLLGAFGYFMDKSEEGMLIYSNKLKKQKKFAERLNMLKKMLREVESNRQQSLSYQEETEETLRTAQNQNKVTELSPDGDLILKDNQV